MSFAIQTPRIVDCPTNHLEWPEGFRDMHLLGDVLIANTFRHYTAVDVSKPEDGQVISQHRSCYDRTTKSKLLGDRLYCFADEGLEIVDYANPSAPREVTRLPRPGDEAIRSGAFSGDDFVVAYGEGLQRLDLETGALELLAASGHKDRVAHESDTLASESVVVTVDWRQRMQVYERGGSGFSHAKGIGNAGFSMHLAWEDEGRTFISAHDNSVARVDVSTPSKTKRKKARKTGSVRLADEWLRVGDEILVAGLDGKGALNLVVLDATDDTLPVLAKHKVPGFDPRESSSDSMRGLLWTGTHLLVASYARRLYVVGLD